ncbi:hypothetical protein ACTVFP_23495, partial [Escherichia coli]|uniref:hypothetical protein n=1 Tax=Escherichia coli TaxID=562 RepID=UPI003FA604DA
LLGSFRHAIVPGALVSHEADANYWLAVNVTLDDVEPLAKALAEHLVTDNVGQPEDATELEENKVDKVESDLASPEESSQTESSKVSDEKEAKTSRNVTTEPLYNPMLDLINHDFG